MQPKPLIEKVKSHAPHTSLNWELYRKNTFRKVLAATVIFGIIFCGVAIYIQKKYENKETLVPVFVAKDTIEQNTVLNSHLFKIEALPSRLLPDQAVTDIGNVENTKALVRMPKNSILTVPQYKTFLSSDSYATQLNEDEYAFTLYAEWVSHPITHIKPKDHVTLYASPQKAPLSSTSQIATNVEVMDTVVDKQSSKSFLILKLNDAQIKNALNAYANSMRMAVTVNP